MRLLVPGKSDVAITQWAARAAYGSLRAAGVRIWQYQPRVLHAKTVLVDDDWATVGTANFDYRSFFVNDELNLFEHGTSADTACRPVSTGPGRRCRSHRRLVAAQAMTLAAYPTDRLVGTPLALTTPGVGAPSPQGRTWPGRRPVESVVSRLPVVQVSSRNWPAGIASSSLTLPEARERLTHVQASIARPQRADDHAAGVRWCRVSGQAKVNAPSELSGGSGPGRPVRLANISPDLDSRMVGLEGSSIAKPLCARIGRA
ncbi:Cardiolipin synthase [Rhodanobacter lindaniclasticus]